jgi:hypothetical protein
MTFYNYFQSSLTYPLKDVLQSIVVFLLIFKKLSFGEVRMEFELRALAKQVQVTPPALFALVIFQIGYYAFLPCGGLGSGSS